MNQNTESRGETSVTDSITRFTIRAMAFVAYSGAIESGAIRSDEIDDYALKEYRTDPFFHKAADSTVFSILGEIEHLRAELEKVKGERDGNWVDKWGACKVCDGEIPHGHSVNCDIWKLEQQLTTAKAELETVKAAAKVNETGLLAQFKELETKLVYWEQGAELNNIVHDLRKQLKQAKAENETLRKDGERLDWMQANGTTGYWYEEGCQRDYAFPAIRMKNQWADDPVSDDIRQAIDAAIGKEAEVKNEQ